MNTPQYGTEYSFDNENPHISPKSKRKDIMDTAYIWLQSMLEAVLATVLFFTLILRTNVIMGISMRPTLQENDKIVVSPLLYDLDYGDIAVIWATGIKEKSERGDLIVKRVIGFAGDVIDIDEEGTVYRNGEPLEEEYAAEKIDKYSRGNLTYPHTVEENCIFVLGDNRNHSTDSRWEDDGETEVYVGCIDMKYVVGKALFRIFPFDRIGAL